MQHCIQKSRENTLLICSFCTRCSVGAAIQRGVSLLKFLLVFVPGAGCDDGAGLKGKARVAERGACSISGKMTG